MSITKDRKSALIKEYARSEGDTGSPEVQIAVLTERINELTFVSRLRGRLDYLKGKDQQKYVDIIGKLSIRK